MRLDIKTVIDRYKDRLFTAAFSICQNTSDAEDAVQDTLIKYYEKNIDFEDENHLKAWLLRVVINRSKDICTSFWRRHKQTWEDYMNEIPFDEPQEEVLFEVVMKLPTKYRIVIHLFYYEDFSIQEIAAVLNRRETTVKSQLSRARKLLKQTLQEE